MKKHLAVVLICLLSYAVFAQAPVITSFSPTSGVIGTIVTITGSNFSAALTGNIVYFGAVKALVSAASATSLTVAVPPGATYQPLSVTTGGLTAYAARPFVTTFPGASTTFNSFSFAAPIDSTTGLYPYGVVIVDLDGDGKPDLATANNANSPVSTISILRNNSAKDSVAFAPGVDLPAPSGSTPYSIAAGDIDGDGKQDLVVTNNVASTVSVYRNTSSPGTISFAARVEFATGNAPFSVAIGDLDGDGRPDLAVTNYLSTTVSVFRNTSTAGSVSFAAKADIPTPATARYVTIGDIDGDGKPDLATANELSSNVSVYRNTSTTGTISFATHVDLSVGGSPLSVAIGDLDGDGKPDLAVANNANKSVEIIKNVSTSGNISLSPAVDFPTGSGAYHVAIGDMNGDGKPDLMVATVLSIYAYANNSTSGNISFVNPYNYYDFPPYFIALGDLDGDTKPDLVTANFTHNTVSIFRNKFNEPAITSFSPATAAAGATVTITGVNFTGATAVYFGGTPAASFIVNADNSMTAVVGAGVSGNVSVVTPNGRGDLPGFVFAGPPLVNTITPDTGVIGSVITITGQNFTGCTGVSFGSVAASSFTVSSPTTISAVVSSGSTGSVSVTTPYGTGTLPGFTFIPPPAITSFSPDSAGNGTTVTIIGTNFFRVTSVAFGGLPAASFTVVSSDTIRAQVAGGSTGSVSVTAFGGVSSLPGFRFLAGPPPVVTSFSPLSGIIGSAVTIQGNNFNTVPAGNIVFFGGAKATVTAASAVSLTVTVPYGAAYAPLTVVNTANGLIGYSSGLFDITSTKTGHIDTTTFAPKVDFTGYNARQIVLADLDGDGKLDLAGESSGATVSVQRNTSTPGNLSFAPSVDLPIISSSNGGSIITPIAVADIDGDGKQDIVAINIIANDTGYVSVLLNTSTPGTISFASQVVYKSIVNSWALAVADFDGDGRADILVQGQGANSIFRNNSSVGVISFMPQQYISLTGAFSAFGDFNNDGKADLVQNDGTIQMSTSTDSSFSFTSVPVYYPTYDYYPQTISVGDLDGDGKLDIYYVTSDVDNGRYTILRNTSSGNTISFAVQEFPCNIVPFRGALGDIDGDGRPDLVAMIRYGTAAVFKNTSTPGAISFGASPSFLTTSNQSEMAVGDLDGDGRLDVVVTDYNTFNTTILRNQSGSVPAITVIGDTTFCQGNSVKLVSSAAAGNQWYKDNTAISNATGDTLVVTTGGRYTFTTTSGGTTSPFSAGVMVVVNPVPAKPTITWDAVKGMVSSASSGNQWYITDTATAVTGATGQSYKPTSNGDFYYLKVTQAGCSSPFSDRYEYFITATVNVGPPGNYLEIAPNPVIDFISVTYHTTGIGIAAFDAQLFDLNGKMVLSTTVASNGGRIDLKQIARGMYFLKLFSSDGKINTTVPIIKL